MSGDAWMLMLVILGMNWGGFIGLLIYGARQSKKRKWDVPNESRFEVLPLDCVLSSKLDG